MTDYDAYYRHADHGGKDTGCSQPWEHCAVCADANAVRAAKREAERFAREATPEYQARVKERAETQRRFNDMYKRVYSDALPGLFGGGK